MNKMLYICLFPLICAAILSTGCASIFNSPIESVRIDSTPQNAPFTVVNERGEQVAEGVTPDVIELYTSGPPFQPARYFVNYQHEDHPGKTKSVVGKISGWYIADIVFYFPGLIGALIIDPYTGTMYNLPAESHVELSGESDSAQADSSTAAVDQPIRSSETVQ